MTVGNEGITAKKDFIGSRERQHADYSQHPEAETRHENGDQSFEIRVVQCA